MNPPLAWALVFGALVVVLILGIAVLIDLGVKGLDARRRTGVDRPERSGHSVDEGSTNPHLISGETRAPDGQSDDEEGEA